MSSFIGSRLLQAIPCNMICNLELPVKPVRLSRGLGSVFLDEGDFAGAQPLFEGALTIRQKVLVPNIPIRRQASTASRSYCVLRATSFGRDSSSSERWQSGRKRSTPSTPIRQPHETILRGYLREPRNQKSGRDSRNQPSLSNGRYEKHSRLPLRSTRLGQPRQPIRVWLAS
jgi:hypothetical protein